MVWADKQHGLKQKQIAKAAYLTNKYYYTLFVLARLFLLRISD